jgi:hypothetical protein
MAAEFSEHRMAEQRWLAAALLQVIPDDGWHNKPRLVGALKRTYIESGGRERGRPFRVAAGDVARHSLIESVRCEASAPLGRHVETYRNSDLLGSEGCVQLGGVLARKRRCVVLDLELALAQELVPQSDRSPRGRAT